MTLWSTGDRRARGRARRRRARARPGAEVAGDVASPTRRSASGVVAVGEHGAPRGPGHVGQAPRPGVVVRRSRAGRRAVTTRRRPRRPPRTACERAVEVEVVGLHVGDDGDVGAVDEERAVALVGLGDEGRHRCRGRRWCRAGRSRRRRRRTGRRRSDAARRRASTSSWSCRWRRRPRPARRPASATARAWDAVQHPQAGGAGGDELDVVVADGRRHDHRVDVGDVGRRRDRRARGTAGRAATPACGPSAASDPLTGSPRASRCRATADMPAPPMAMRCTRPSSSSGGTGAAKS